MNNKVSISSCFDSGNINVISSDSHTDIQLEINKDAHSDFYQWFHYKVQSAVGTDLTMRIVNASSSAYAEGWENYQAVASYDRVTWFRVDTDYSNGELIISHKTEYTSVYFAYFAPYSYERHQDLLHRIQHSPLCTLEHLGETLDGRDMTVAMINDDKGELNQQDTHAKKNIWVIARQHPGESMAEWFVEGLLDRLLDEDDAVTRKLLETCNFYIVPNMNPDGSVRGHLRTNALGSNLNREWLEPTMDKSPEVFLVRQMMLDTGVDLFLDIHGDEAIPYNFVAGCEGNASYTDELKALEDTFKTSFLQASPDFQVTHGYDKDEPGQGNQTIGCNWVGEQFNCISFTLEMPFKDNDDLPDPVFGWSPERCYGFGQSILTPILNTLKSTTDNH